MASVKVKFKPSTVIGNPGTVYYQIIHERKQRQLFTDYHIYPEEWHPNRSTVTVTPQGERKGFILSVRDRIRLDIDRLAKIVRRLDRDGLSYASDDIVEEFHRQSSEYTVFNFMETLIIKFRQAGRLRTAETYAATLNSFRRFRNDEDLMLDALTSETMEAFEGWHRRRGLTPNTTSFYLRILRAVYNRAVEQDITEDRHPFRHVYTGVDKTLKRALPLGLIKRIKELDLSLLPKLDYARDMFMMSFMLRGMSFVDMAYLRKSDLANGYVTYRRRKTGQQLVIKWTRDMQHILDKYPENPTGYLLPVICKSGSDERSLYLSASYNINYSLKRVARKAGIDIPLTLYVARHSWASAARTKGIPLSVISEGMGHDSERTTRIYLADLDTSVVDQANSIILASL